MVENGWWWSKTVKTKKMVENCQKKIKSRWKREKKPVENSIKTKKTKKNSKIGWEPLKRVDNSGKQSKTVKQTVENTWKLKRGKDGWKWLKMVENDWRRSKTVKSGLGEGPFVPPLNTPLASRIKELSSQDMYVRTIYSDSGLNTQFWERKKIEYFQNTYLYNQNILHWPRNL